MIAAIPLNDLVRPATCWTHNQEITVTYATESVLPMLKPGGTWMAPMARSPLSFNELVECFRAIREHPNYDGQTMTLNDREGVPVSCTPEGLILTGGM